MMVVLLLLFLLVSSLFTGFRGLNVEPERQSSTTVTEFEEGYSAMKKLCSGQEKNLVK